MTTIKPTHEVKIWPQYFEGILAGTLTYQIRQAEREYMPGDELVLREWVPTTGGAVEGDGFYTGRKTARSITYRMDGPALGIGDGYCILGLEDPAVEALRDLLGAIESDEKVTKVLDRGAALDLARQVLASRPARP
jgi:hypothetical protein